MIAEVHIKMMFYFLSLLGVERTILFAVTEWLKDIKKNQLPTILGGIGPMYSLVQFGMQN